jgi:hypothetical protein
MSLPVACCASGLESTAPAAPAPGASGSATRRVVRPGLRDNGVLNDAHDLPEWWSVGHQDPFQSANGGCHGEQMWLAKVAREPGTAVITTTSPFSMPVGGVVVLPRWF